MTITQGFSHCGSRVKRENLSLLSASPPECARSGLAGSELDFRSVKTLTRTNSSNRNTSHKVDQMRWAFHSMLSPAKRGTTPLEPCTGNSAGIVHDSFVKRTCLNMSVTSCAPPPAPPRLQTPRLQTQHMPRLCSRARSRVGVWWMERMVDAS